MQVGRMGENEIEEVPAFARKASATDEAEYAAEVAEDRDLVYLIENTCIHCNKLMSKSEVKILPPSYIQERDQYVSGGVVKRRLMCLQCYNALRSSTRQRARFDRFRSRSGAGIVRTALVKLLGSEQ
ncbi:MAG: hypothetical protein KGH57_01060 [Candidatus Micrarchaeota archaeon]|nr:hypothetical protein [Candidatus Micrarchaeota archaeon]